MLNEYRGGTEATSVARGMLDTVERFSFLFLCSNIFSQSQIHLVKRSRGKSVHC